MSRERTSRERTHRSPAIPGERHEGPAATGGGPIAADSSTANLTADHNTARDAEHRVTGVRADKPGLGRSGNAEAVSRPPL